MLFLEYGVFFTFLEVYFTPHLATQKTNRNRMTLQGRLNSYQITHLMAFND